MLCVVVLQVFPALACFSAALSLGNFLLRVVALPPPFQPVQILQLADFLLVLPNQLGGFGPMLEPKQAPLRDVQRLPLALGPVQGLQPLQLCLVLPNQLRRLRRDVIANLNLADLSQDHELLQLTVEAAKRAVGVGLARGVFPALGDELRRCAPLPRAPNAEDRDAREQEHTRSSKGHVPRHDVFLGG